MALPRLALAGVAFSIVAACGAGSSSSTDPDASTVPGQADGASATDPRCPVTAPKAGSTCTAEQTGCSGGNLCCEGAWSCDRSTLTWRLANGECPCRIDAAADAATDAATDAAKRDAGPVACGDKTCGPNEYCTKAYGGPKPPDGGSNISYSCNPIPIACAATPTCACVKPGGCTCNDVDGSPFAECYYP